jgi:hypothetical protein
MPPLRAGTLLPFLGPGVLSAEAGVPRTPVDLALALNSKVAVPGRIRGNLWSSAQWIESHRHKRTLDALLNALFSAPGTPPKLHRWLASLRCPLIVDSWYDHAMAGALIGHPSWGLVQGTHRAGATRDIWTQAFTAEGDAVPPEVSATWTTMLYKPHGGAWPAGRMLASDADYVEVLTEIDIQTPIPDVVKARRAGRGFLFLGCRFDDQLLRTFARQILKTSAGPHYALVPSGLSRNEARFLETYDITPLPNSMLDGLNAIAAEALGERA